MTQPLILIIEDDEKSRRLMSDVLCHQGFHVVDVSNAEDGLAIIRSQHPKLVLMDIHLPGMSGIEALQRIRDDPAIAETLVLAITASVMGNDWKVTQEIGFDGIELKPINLKSFLARVHELMAS